MEKEREQQVYLARLAEQAERYDGASPPLLVIRLGCSRSCIFIVIVFALDELCRLIVKYEARTSETDLFFFHMHLLCRRCME